VAFVIACAVGATVWSASLWSPEHQAKAARIEEQTRTEAVRAGEQTRLNVTEREAWIENEMPEVHATWGKVLQGLLIAIGIVLASLGLCWIATWAINVQARRKACKRLPAWQILPQNRAVLLPGGTVYHTGHGATDAWTQPIEADTGRLLAAGQADAIRARAILGALRGVVVPNRPQRRALEWAECELLEAGGEE